MKTTNEEQKIYQANKIINNNGSCSGIDCVECMFMLDCDCLFGEDGNFELKNVAIIYLRKHKLNKLKI